MAWATAGNIITTNLDAGTDSPASARPNLKAALDELTIVSNNLGTTDGAAKLEANGVIRTNVTGVGTSTGSLSVTSATGMVNITSFINLAPVAYAALPGSPSAGDIAFLTTDSSSATKNKPVYYDGTNWRYFNDDSTI